MSTKKDSLSQKKGERETLFRAVRRIRNCTVYRLSKLLNTSPQRGANLDTFADRMDLASVVALYDASGLKPEAFLELMRSCSRPKKAPKKGAD